MSALAAQWSDLVTASLLGSDRRPPPSPQGVVADVVADVTAGRDLDAAQSLSTQVAALAVARRAGVAPGPPLTALAAAPADARPVTSPDLGRLWRRMIVDWPILDDEVQLAIAASGRRTAPDLLVAALARARPDAARHARVVRAGGPLATWLLELQPFLRARSAKPPAPDVVAALPPLPVPDDLARLAADSPARFADHLRTEFEAGRFGPPHRALLTNLMARMPAAALLPTAQQLARVSPSRASIGLAMSLADLASVRHQLLAHLEPAHR